MARAELAKRKWLRAAGSSTLDRAARLEADAVGAGDRMLAPAGRRSARQRMGSRTPPGAAWQASWRDCPGRNVGRSVRMEDDQSSICVPTPVAAPVAGDGQVSTSGIRSRGTTFASRAGSPVRVPADGS